MKKILFWLFAFTFAISQACAQDAATQAQIDQITGEIQGIQDAQMAENKRLDAIEKEISDMQDKLSQPAVSDSASADDLKKLAAQVQEIDKKRQDDNEQIVKALEKLDKAMSVTPPSRKSEPVAPADNSTTAPAPGAQKGYYYEVKGGDTLSAIAKAYRAQGIKVTTEQIEAANPGLSPTSLIVGKKIFIPQSQ